VLAPVFLATAGLQVDAGTLGSRAAVVTLLLVLALATTGKLVGGYVGGRAGHLGHWPSLALGGALNARGVVEIVAAHVGRQAGLLTPTMYTVIVLVALATSVMAGPMLVWATARGDAAAAQGADRPLDRRVLDGGSARTRHIDPSVTSEGAPCAGTSMPSRPITSSSTRQADRASRAMSSRSREST
jgi:Kef-type K+ transport system membrane component KefB